MKKEFILRVQMKSGGNRTFREWGWSGVDAYQNLKKSNSDVGYLVEHKPA